VKHVMFLVMVVLVLEMLIVKPVVLQELLNIFYMDLLANVLSKSVVTVKTSLHLMVANYFVMLDQLLLE